MLVYAIKIWDHTPTDESDWCDGVTLCTNLEPNGIIDISLSKEAGKSESLSFSILPQQNRYADNLKLMTTILEVTYLGKVVFRGRINSIETDFYGQKNIQCEGALSFFLDTIQTAKETLFMSLYQDISFAIEYHNNQMYLSTDGDFRPKQFTVGDVTTVWNPINKTYEYQNESLKQAIIATDGTEIPTTGEEFATSQPKMTEELIPLTIEDGKPKDMLTVYALSHQEIPEGTTSENHYLGLAFYSDNNDPPTFIADSRYIATPAGTSDFITIFAEKGNIPSNARYVRIIGTTYGTGLGLIENATRIDFKTENAMTTSEYFDEVYCRRYGGFLRVRYGESISQNYVDYMSGKKKDVSDSSIEYAVNLIDLSSSQEYSDPYSIIIPTSGGKVWAEGGGHDGYSYDSTTKKYSHKTLVFVDHEGAIKKFGRIIRLQDVGELSNVTEVRKAAKRFMEIYDPMLPDKLEITAVDLAAIKKDGTVNQLDVGDTVRVTCPHLGINTTLMCTALSLNFQNPENSTYTIGTYVPDTEDYKRETLSAAISKKK